LLFSRYEDAPSVAYKRAHLQRHKTTQQRSNAKTIQNRGDVIQSLVAPGRHIGPRACPESIKYFKAHTALFPFTPSLPLLSLSRRLFPFQLTHLIIYRLLVTCSYRFSCLSRVHNPAVYQLVDLHSYPPNCFANNYRFFMTRWYYVLNI